MTPVLTFPGEGVVAPPAEAGDILYYLQEYRRDQVLRFGQPAYAVADVAVHSLEIALVKSCCKARTSSAARSASCCSHSSSALGFAFGMLSVMAVCLVSGSINIKLHSAQHAGSPATLFLAQVRTRGAQEYCAASPPILRTSKAPATLPVVARLVALIH